MVRKLQLTSWVLKGNQLLASFGIILQSFFLLSFRLYWGWKLFLTGKGKLLNHEQVVGYFSSLGIPLPAFNAWFVGAVECFGGLLLLFGLFSRPIALLIAGNMLVAYLSVADDRESLLGIFSDPEPFLQASPFFFLLTALLILAFGPGKLSFDELLSKTGTFKRLRK